MHKPIFTAAILGLGGFMAYRLWKLKRFSGNANIRPELRGMDIVNLGFPHLAMLRTRFNLHISNPESTSFTATHPNVTVLNQNRNAIAHSQPSNQTYTIQGGSTTTINDIILDIPASSLISVFNFGLINEIRTIINRPAEHMDWDEKIRQIGQKLMQHLNGRKFYVQTRITIDGISATDMQEFQFGEGDANV